MLDWKTMADKDSMYNTPPTYGIYVLGLVAKWVEDMGGVKAMQERAEKRSSMLYDYLDSQDFYKTVAAKDSRSRMNVTFRTGNDELDAKFAKGVHGSRHVQPEGSPFGRRYACFHL